MSSSDEQAIIRLINHYSDAVFRRDASDWGACWTDDSVWHLMGTAVQGKAAIVGLWEQAMAGFAFVAFFAQPGQIEVQGDRATGRVWTHEVLEMPDGTITRPVGRYDDVYVKQDGRWLFAERRYQMLKG